MDENDIPSLKDILQDDEVMYAYGHSFTDADVDEWLHRQMERYEMWGFGLWAMVLKSSGVMIGQAGLAMQPCEEREVLEIGYLLNKTYWHCGYAREAAAACREYAFKVLNTGEVCSIIREDNTASIRVAESIGMKKRKKFMAPVKVLQGKHPPPPLLYRKDALITEIKLTPLFHSYILQWMLEMPQL